MSERLFRRWEHGNARVSVYYDECPIHPYIMNDMASTLANFNEDESYLPYAGSKRTEARLRSNYTFIESKDEMKEWIDEQQKSGKPYVVFGFKMFDKYGGLVLHKDFDEWVTNNYGRPGYQDCLADWLKSLDGALLINHDRFRRWVDADMQMSDNTMVCLMWNILTKEFAELDAYSWGNCFDVVYETKCQCCNQWVAEKCIGGYYLTGSEQEMFESMTEHIPADNEDFSVIRNAMTSPNN